MHVVNRVSERLRLRELSAADVPGVHAVYGDPEATRHLSFTPRTLEEVNAIVERSVISAAAEPREEYALAVDARGPSAQDGSPSLIGFGRLATDPHQQSAATLGFALRPDAWGVGYGTETVHLLLGVAFEELELHRVWAARAPLNAASDRTLSKAGFVEEGRIRGHVHVRGAWRDSLTYGILREEWKPPSGTSAQGRNGHAATRRRG